jgi:flagellar basal body rod protein FlgG
MKKEVVMMYVYNNVSALNMLGVKMSSIANNIANLETDKYKKTKTTLSEGENPGSVTIEITRDDSPGHKVYTPYEGELVERELSNVNIVEEFAQSMTTRRNFEANLKYLQSVDEILGKVIDIIG